MLNNFPIGIQAKDVDPRVSKTFEPYLVPVKDDVLAVSDCPFHVAPLTGVFFGHHIEIGNKPVFAVRDVGGWKVVRPCISRGSFRGAAIVKQHLIERDDVGFIGVRRSLQSVSSGV